MWQSVGAIGIAFLISFLITPWVIKKAFDWGAVDLPDYRKVHLKPMPRMGGLAVYIAFVIAVLIGIPLNLSTIGLLVGITCITIVGLLDDIKGLSPFVKLLGQIIAALSVIPFGIQVEFFTNVFNDDIINLGILSIPITISWIVMVTNAINLIDGLDGLATGISIIAALTMALVAFSQFSMGIVGLQEMQKEILLLPLLLAAAGLGFLRYNYHPAKIFLGDSGSMLLGFTLGLISIMGFTKGAVAVSVIVPSLVVPLVVLGLPLLDTVFAVVRRYNNRKPIFQPDKGHLHHCLLNLGFNHPQAVLLIYGISIFMGLMAIILNLISSDKALVLLLVLAIIVLIGASKLGVLGRKNKVNLEESSKIAEKK